MPKVSFMVYKHCLSSTITALIDAFSICNALHDDMNKDTAETPAPLFEMTIAAAAKEPVLTNGGVLIQPDVAFHTAEKPDLIIIPPRLFARQPDEEELSQILPWLKNNYQKGVRIGTLCTGSFILAMTGLLDQKTATTNWLYAEKFQRQFPRVRLMPDRILTDDGGLICSGAITAMYNLALYVIEIFASADLSRKCAGILLVDRNRKSQQPYMTAVFRKNHGDRQILKGQNWFERNYATRFSIDDVAAVVGLSPRHFKRRFKQATGENPLRYLQLIRLEGAKDLLETSLEGIEAITNQVGYEDSRTFRRLFKKFTSLSPREYRDRFGTVQVKD